MERPAKVLTQSVRILVVDDDEYNRKYLVHVLRKEEYHVDEARSGEMALAQLSGHDYDLVISDLHMYKVGGLDVLEAAKSKDRHVQVMILTGYGTIPTAVQAMKRGAFEYLPKPINQDALLIKVKNALERRRLGMLLEEQQRKIDEHHLMLERDLNLAKKVQHTLVPRNFENEHVAVGVEYLPMIGIGGDFADLYLDESGYLYITVIDVTGHGISAALLVNRICSELRKTVREGLEPRQVLHLLNTFFCESFAHTGMFLTLMSVKFDFVTGQLTYAGSAHPAGLLYCARKKVLRRLDSQNTIIGFEPAGLEKFIQSEVEIAPGDRLILYTDGVIETENEFETPFGLLGLRNSLQRHINKDAFESARAFVRDVRAFGHGDQRDDILLIFAEIKK